MYVLLPALDLPLWLASAVLSLQTLILTTLFAWAAYRATDLVVAAYTNSERLRGHRSLSEMVVPGLLRGFKW